MRSRSAIRAVLMALLAVSGLTACSEGGPTDPVDQGDDGSRYEAPDLDVLLAGLAMDSAMAAISEADIAVHIGALAHDSMKGRLTGRLELEMAAAYVADGLGRSGVEPAGTDGYLARWDLDDRYRLDRTDTLTARPPNVVGVVRGSDPELADSYVVVTAHYDHVGVAAPSLESDSIYNGADDNASGTAVLMEVADAVAAMPTPPRRSVLFLAVSGEELGLLGSEAYMAAPTVPVSGMVANVNLDMVSRGPLGAAYGIGWSLTTLGPLADAVSEQRPELGVDVRSDGALGSDLIARSDHFHFAVNGIPALGIFGGFHPDYHTPRDETDTVDMPKATSIARLATYLVATLSMMDEPPTWTAVGEAYMGGYR